MSASLPVFDQHALLNSEVLFSHREVSSLLSAPCNEKWFPTHALILTGVERRVEKLGEIVGVMECDATASKWLESWRGMTGYGTGSCVISLLLYFLSRIGV
jgi:hypothetical protein